MTTEKTVSTLWLKALLAAAEHQGLNQASLLQQAGLQAQQLQTGQRVSLSKTLALWRAAEAASPVTDFGLAMGEWVKPTHFQLFSLVLLHSRDLADALEKTIRYTRILSDAGQFRIERQNHQALICYQPLGDNFSRHQVDAVLALLRGFADWLACRRIPLLRADFCHERPSQLDNYQRIFDCPLHFSQPKNALLFSEHWLHEPLALEDTELAAMHEQMLEQQLISLQQPELRQQVENWLQQQPVLDVCRAQLAQQLLISERTLQRRLSEQGLSFQALLDECRQQRAHERLTDSDDSMTDIALQLGLSSSSFTRACHRWFAASPLVVRQQYRYSESSNDKTSS